MMLILQLEELNKPVEKKSKKSELDELNKLFKPVQQTVGKGKNVEKR